MSLFFSDCGLNADRLGVSNPTSRDKLLAAVHELKLFGGPVPDERQFRLNVSGTNIDGVSPRTKKRGRSLPTGPPNMQLLFKGALPGGIPSSRGFDVVERKTPQEVLHEQSEEISEDNEKGKVQVHTAGLQSDAEYTTIEITNQTTSKQLVSLLLTQCDAGCKDHNLFYIAVEIGIQKKDSSLPISQMMVLADDARPLEIHSRQPSGEAKFHLKMRSGGLLRVQAGILSPGATYKCVQISRQTRADEVVKMILSGYGSDEPPEKFVLVESLSSSEVGRILEADECPLEVQSRWKVGEQRTFTLTLAEFEGVLQSDDKEIAVHGVMDDLQESSIDFDKNSLSEDQHTSSSASEIEGKENTEQIRKRRTSIDALDLHLPQVNQVKRKVSQIDNLRHKFHEYHRKPSSVASSDESSISGSEEGTKRRKVSQIDRFRSKFLAYAHNGGKGEAGSLNTLCENVREGANNSGTTTRTKTPSSRASSDGEDLPRFSSSPPTYLRDNNNNGDVSQQNDKNLEHKRNNTVHKTSHPPRLSLATVLQYYKLITVTLNREPGEGWGIELVHVTKTGSSMSQKDNGAKDEEKVVYVLHSGNGQNSIVNTSSTIDSSGDLLTASGTSTPHSPSSSGSSEHEITSILGSTSRSCVDMDKSKDDMLHIVHMQNLRRRKTGSSNFNMDLLDVSPIVSRPGSARHAEQINSIPQRPCSAFAQWSKEGSPQPRPGVRIVALTEGGVAARSGEVAVDDLIVEINEHFVLNSPLEPVIAAMQEAHTATIVVARAQDPELKPEEKENKTDYKEDIKELTLQIQNLVTKVSEMQNDLKKKDDKIKTLKKMVKKNTADSKGKIYQSVQVLV